MVKQLKRKLVAVFDFDGVIASYDGWKGPDVFGKPNYEVIRLMQALYNHDWHIVIWTTRVATPKLIDWLKKYKVQYDGINTNNHNPDFTSAKPIYDVYIDDRAIGYNGQSATDLWRQIHIAISHRNDLIKKRGVYVQLVSD